MRDETRTVSEYASEGQPSPRRQPARMLLLFALCIVGLGFQTKTSYAQTSLADLKGSWVLSFTGTTGCGQVAERAVFTLSSEGKATDVTLTTHGQCEDLTQTGLTFEITSLSSTGGGSANLSCGEGCGWALDIEVAPGNNIFSVVDVSPGNPMNYLAGMAVKKQ